MKKIILIAFGGCFGALLRYSIKGIPAQGNFPFTTLFINTMGCLLLAFVSALSISAEKSDLKTGITTGFCGAFTTFSTLCKESVQFMTNGNDRNAFLYLLLLILLGLSAVYTGTALANTFNHKQNETIPVNGSTVDDEVD